MAPPLQFIVHTVDSDTEQKAQQIRAAKEAAFNSRQVKKRKARPGQQPPQRRPVPDEVLDNDSQDPSSGASDGSGSDSDGPASTSSAQPQTTSTKRRGRRSSHQRWRQRNARLAERWEENRSQHTAQIRASERFREAANSRRLQLLKQDIESSIEASNANHPCLQVVALELEQISKRTVICLDWGHAVPVEVPTMRCSFCREEWEVSACQVFYFPSTPVRPNFWISVQMLEQYRQLGTRGGLSMTHFSDAAASIRQLTGCGNLHFTARCKLNPLVVAANFCRRVDSCGSFHGHVSSCAAGCLRQRIENGGEPRGSAMTRQRWACPS